VRTPVKRRKPPAEVTYAITSARDVLEAMAAIAALPLTDAEAERYELVVRKVKAGVTAKQRGFYWGILRAIGRETGFPAYAWHLQLKRDFLGVTESRLPDGSLSEEPISLDDLNVGEMADYINQILAYAAEHDIHIGIATPRPSVSKPRTQRTASAHPSLATH